MPCCAVLQCKNNSKSITLKNGGVSYHRFPQHPSTKEKWIDATGRVNWFPTRRSVICSKHFSDDDFSTSPKGYRRVKHKVFPTLRVVKYFQQDDNETCEDDKTDVPMEEDDAEDDESLQEEALDDLKNKEKNTSKASSSTSKFPAKCMCGNLLDSVVSKMEKDEASYKSKIIMKNRKINNLEKINMRLKKRNVILRNTLNLLKKKKYVEPSVLRELSQQVSKEPVAEVDLLEVKEEKIQYDETTGHTEKDQPQVKPYGHNFIEDPIPIKLEVIDDSENYGEVGSTFSAENPLEIGNRHMISFNVPPIERFMNNENEKKLMSTLMDLLDAYDKWALKISKDIKSMTNMVERINAMNATQSLVDAYLAKDAKTIVHTATSNSDGSSLSTVLDPQKIVFVTPTLPATGVIEPQQGTSHAGMAPQTIQIQPITLPNVLQTQDEKNTMNKR